MINDKDRCKVCHGKKVTQESKNIEIHIDPGMRDGHKITLHGQGDQMVSVIAVSMSLGVDFETVVVVNLSRLHWRVALARLRPC